MSVPGLTNQFGNMGVGGSPQPDNQNYGGYGQYGANQGGPPPPAQYNAAPPQPTYQPPSDKPPIPQGWTPYFDQQHQRWYYVEEATGKTQWEAPGYDPSRQLSPPIQSPPAQGNYGPPAGPPPGGAYAGYEQSQTKGDKEGKKGSGAGGMLLGAAGGLAAGAIGGAVLHHALHRRDSSDDERPSPQSYAAPMVAPSVTNFYVNEYGSPSPAMYVNRDDSDRESLDEAREDVYVARAKLREARERVDSSSASSSDIEELEEREQELRYAEDRYEEEREAYEEDYEYED